MPLTPQRFAVFAALLALATGAAAPAGVPLPRLDVRSWTLPNGLEVLVLEDHTAPIATVQVFYHVGSKNERPGQRGIAHMFEHMMFKGTDRVSPEAHARLLKEVGGVANAFTTEDVTAYHDTVPPSYVGFALELEANRMRHLALTQATVDSERQVVMEEKRLRIDNDPVGKALELFRATAFTRHPYQWTPAGSLEELPRIGVPECQRFYDTWYRPDNATVIVVGDVRAADVRALVAKHFGGLAAGPTQPRDIAPEPPQHGRRERTLEIPIEVPVVIGGYHVPPARHDDTAALTVLSSILSDGESSRMHQRLVRRDRLALGAGGVVQAMEDPGLFLVFAVHLPDKDQAAVRSALLDEVARVRRQPVSAEELEKAKNQLATQYIHGLETVDGVATQLGQARYVERDWRRFLDEASRYLAVTAADVQRVAEAYLTDDNLTLVSVRPGAPR